VLLPYYGSDANEFSSAALPQLLAKNNVAMMTVSGAGYLRDTELVTLRELIKEVVGRSRFRPAGWCLEAFLREEQAQFVTLNSVFPEAAMRV